MPSDVREGQDGRHAHRWQEPDEVRIIDAEAGLMPRLHGSALFTRGQTMAIATATLGLKASPA